VDIFSTQVSILSLTVFFVLSKSFLLGVGADIFLSTLLCLQLEIITDDLNSLDEKTLWNLIRLKNCGYDSIENVILQFVYYFVTPIDDRDSDVDYSMVEGMFYFIKYWPVLHATILCPRLGS